MNLSQALRASTRDAHRHAENHPWMRELFAARVSPAGYAGLLAALLPLYRALEAGLARHAAHPVLAGLPLAALGRSAALQADLHELHRAGFAAQAPGAGAAALADAVRDASLPVLLAHAYVRYLGDLSGGQMMRAVLAPVLGPELAARALRFHDFGDPTRVAQLGQALRHTLDAAQQAHPEWTDTVLAQASRAFALHGALFDDLARL